MKTNILQSDEDYLAQEKKKKKPRNWGQRWTISELKYIEESAGKRTFKQIAYDIGRTYSAVAQQAAKLGIAVQEPEYSDKEDEIIRSTYPDGGTAAAVLALEREGFIRTPISVTTRAKLIRALFVDKTRFEYLISLPQNEFFEHLKLLYKNSTGAKLTHAKLAKMCHVSVSRVDHWFSSGASQEPLAIYMKHHFVLACRYAKRDV